MPFAPPDLPPPAYVFVQRAPDRVGHSLSADRGQRPFQSKDTRGLSTDNQPRKPDTPPPTAPSSFAPAPFVVANTVNFAREGVQIALSTPTPVPAKMYNTGRDSTSSASTASTLLQDSDHDLCEKALACILELRSLIKVLKPLAKELEDGDSNTIDDFEAKQAKFTELTTLKAEKEEELKVLGRKAVRVEAYIKKKKAVLLQAYRDPKLGKRELLEKQLEQVEAALDDYENPIKGIERGKLVERLAKRKAHLTALLEKFDKHQTQLGNVKELVHARKDVVKLKRGMAKHKPWVSSAPMVMRLKIRLVLMLNLHRVKLLRKFNQWLPKNIIKVTNRWLKICCDLKGERKLMPLAVAMIGGCLPKMMIYFGEK